MNSTLNAICILVLSLAATVLSSGCGQQEAVTPTEAIRALAVRTQPAALRTFERRLTVQGSLETKNYANVASRADGNLDAIWVDKGDSVIAGKTALFQIDSAMPRGLGVSLASGVGDGVGVAVTAPKIGAPDADSARESR